jgi:hypothetical protein
MSFPLEKCYDKEELKKYGIKVSYDHLGNTLFTYDDIEIGYLLDIIDEPFNVATSFQVDRSCVVSGKLKISPIYKRARYWTKNERGSCLVKEQELNWHKTTLSEAVFHDMLLQRLIRAVEIYKKKLRILKEKFPWMVEYARQKMTNEECIEYDLELKAQTAPIKLLNGNRAVLRLITKQAEKINGYGTLEHEYWFINVRTPSVIGILDGQELIEYVNSWYLVTKDRFTQGNKILMKLNDQEFGQLQWYCNGTY